MRTKAVIRIHDIRLPVHLHSIEATLVWLEHGHEVKSYGY